MKRWLLRAWLASCLGLSVGWAEAEEWRPVRLTSPQPLHSSTAPESVGLGRPISVRRASIADQSSPAAPSSWAAPGSRADRTVGLSRPTVVRAQSPGGEEAYNCGVVSEGPPARGVFPSVSSPGDWFGGWTAPEVDTLVGGPLTFQSDHCFDQFASPVSNPFLFEDPRSLTEVRPIFMYQRLPGKFRTLVNTSTGQVYTFSGGDAFFYGGQARLALNERFSLVLNKLGGVTLHPDSAGPTALSDSTGFAEVWFGPKWTFWRDDCTNTIAALGVTFELGVGSDKVFQDTGSGVTPYITVAQQLGNNWHVMGTFGYRFRLDDQRTESFFLSAHVDYGIFNRIYPLIELNWYHYTRGGNAYFANIEGQDLFNIGATDAEGDILNLAAGVRFKITENIQAGIVYEFPLLSRDDLLSYRITADMIFRY